MKNIARLANEIVDGLDDVELALVVGGGYWSDDPELNEVVQNIAICILAGGCRRY